MDDIYRFLAWYLALSVASMLGLPLARRCLGVLPDQGVTFARPVGLLVIATAYGFLSLTGIVPTSLPGAWAALALAAIVSAACLAGSGWSMLKDALRDHWRVIVLAEAIFLIALIAGALVRAHHPDLMATAKPEEFALFNGLLRSRAWPPQDPWLAGHTTAQPYFGWVFIAFLTTIVRVPAGVGFNLAVATVFALSVGGVFAVVINLLADGFSVTKPANGQQATDTAIGRQILWRAALAPVVIIVAGNLYGLLAVLHANGALATATVVTPRVSDGIAVEWVAQDLWSWLDIQSLSGPPSTPERLTLDPGFWWWYEAGRVVNDRGSSEVPTAVRATTLFPALSFVLGDLEPHVLGLPYALLAIGVAFAGTRLNRTPARAGIPFAWFVAAAGVFGALTAVSLWWAPIVGVLMAVAPFIGRLANVGWRRAAAAGARDIAPGLASLGLGLAAFWPFLATLAAPGWHLAPNLANPTRLQQAVVANAPIVWLMAVFVIGVVWREGSALRWRRVALGVGAMALGSLALILGVAILFESNPAQVAASTLADALTRAQPLDMGDLALRRLLDGWTTLVPLTGLALCVAGVLGSARLEGAAPSRGKAAGTARLPAFALVLVAAACAAYLIPEWIEWRDALGSRTTTLANLSYQAWILGGLGAWVGLSWLAERRRGAGPGGSKAGGGRLATLISQTGTVLLVGAGLLYTALAVRSIATTDPVTLDGTAWVARTYPDDWAATEWLSTHAEPDAVVVEAIGGDDWATGTYSRVSMITGIPAVLGWPGREALWRAGGVELSQREADVARLYVTDDPAEAAAVLRRYHVSYVVVGSLEHSAYGIPPDAVVLTSTCDCLEVAFSQGSLTLLRFNDTVRP